jgi:hypothetical protein
VLRKPKKSSQCTEQSQQADLATGADLAGGTAVLSWAQLLALRYAVRKENWRPNVLAINEMQLHQLLNDDKFVKSVYLPSSQTDIEQGSKTRKF